MGGNDMGGADAAGCGGGGAGADSRFAVRPVQGKVKHTILRQYAGAWAGIIANGVRLDAVRARAGGRTYRLDLVYIDGFAGAGRYGRDFDGSPGPVWGSPVVGVQVLEAQAAAHAATLDVRVTALLCEQEPGCYATLVENLHAAGLQTPVLEVATFGPAALGRVNVLRGDFRQQLADIRRLLGPGQHADPFALAMVDPYGPCMAMEEVRALIGRRRTDAIVLFPYYDLEVRSGSARKDAADRRPMDHQNLAVRDAHFGTEAWRRYADLPAARREDEWARLYGAQLRAADPALLAKNIPLQLGEVARTAYHLFLVTRDPNGAMKMNEVLRGAEVDEQWIRWQGQAARLQSAARDLGQASLFGDDFAVTPPAVARRAYAPEDVAAEVKARAAGRNVSLTGLYGLMADTLYTAGEVRAALTLLKKRRQAEFDGLSSGLALVRVAA